MRDSSLARLRESLVVSGAVSDSQIGKGCPGALPAVVVDDLFDRLAADRADRAGGPAQGDRHAEVPIGRDLKDLAELLLGHPVQGGERRPQAEGARRDDKVLGRGEHR